MVGRPRTGHGARARRRHRQADRAAGRARPRRTRHRPRRGDARRTAPSTPDTPDQRRRSRGLPRPGPLGRRGGRRAVLPLVRPRPRAAGDRPGAQARRPARPGLERPRPAHPLGPQARPDHRHRGLSRRPRRADLVASGLFGFVEEQSWKCWQTSTATRSRTCRSAPTLADRDEDDRERQARRGAGAVRRLRPRHGRHAAAVRDPLLQGHRRASPPGRPPAPSTRSRPSTPPATTATATGTRTPSAPCRSTPPIDPVVQDGSDSDLLLIDFR